MVIQEKMLETQTLGVNHADVALRPYYDPDTFDCGYIAKYKPFQGIVDPQGYTLASKLKVVNSIRNMEKRGRRFLSGSNSSQRSTTQFANAFDSGNSTAMGSVSGMESGGAGASGKSLGEIEFNDLFNVKTWERLFSQILGGFLKKYCQHLVQQPFDVAKILMQVGQFNVTSSVREDGSLSNGNESKKYTHQEGGEEEEDDDDDEEEVNYFENRNSGETKESVKNTNEEQQVIENKQYKSYAEGNIIVPEKSSSMDILSAVLDKEGITGLFRSNHTSFILNFLTQTLDAWFTGFLSPFLGIPDPYFVDIIHSGNIPRSILLSLSASVITGIVLLPLELINTRFIITTTKTTSTGSASSNDSSSSSNSSSSTSSTSSTGSNKRSMRGLLAQWKWKLHYKTLDLSIIALNILNSCCSMTFNKKLIDTFLIIYCQIDKFNGNSSFIVYNTAKFLIKLLQLFVQLPIETVYKNLQVNYLLNTDTHPLYIKDKETLIITPLIPVTGGNAPKRAVWRAFNLGNLWNGWKLGLVSVLCGYGLKVLKYTNYDIQEERF